MTIPTSAPQQATAVPPGATPHIHLAFAALALGVVGDLLFHVEPWGWNVLLGAVMVVVVTALLYRRDRTIAPRVAITLAGAWLLLAAGFAWRSGPDLGMLDVMGMVVIVAIAATVRRGITYNRLESIDMLLGTVDITFNLARAPLAIVTGLGRETSSGHRRLASRVALGVVLALPLLAIFGALLGNADPIFDAAMTDLLPANIENVVSHLALVAACTVVTSAIIWTVLRWRAAAALRRAPVTLGGIEAVTVLGLVALLFTVFVGLQARYLFGGSDFVANTIGLTYAEYARSGFFELVAVDALGLPLVLAAHHLVTTDDQRVRQSLTGLMTLVALLLALIAVSAWYRLSLYARVFGLTEERIVAAAAIVWMGGTLLWFGVTVLRDKSVHFVSGSGVLAFAVLAALHIVNPDAWAMRTQIARAQAGHPFDAPYLKYVGADALPPLLDALPTLSPPIRCGVLAGLDQRKVVTDWRSWTVPRWNAERARIRHRADLTALREACSAR